MKGEIDQSKSEKDGIRKVMTQNELLEARQLASDFWQLETDALFVEEATRHYPWAIAHRFVWISDRRGDILALVCSEHGVEHFRDQNPLIALNRFFHNEGILLPHHLDVHIHANCLRDLLSSPGGLLGCRDTFDREELVLKQWQKRGSTRDIKRLFKKYCREPLIQTHGQNQNWSFAFTNFTRSGGVEKWQIVGESADISGINRHISEPDGTLRFPYV